MRGKKDATTFPDKPVSWIASLLTHFIASLSLKSEAKQACREM